MELNKPHETLLRGEVIQIFQEKGRRIAKIALGPRNYLEVPADSIAEAHLGDAVVIQASTTIYEVALGPEHQGADALGSGVPEFEKD